MVVQARSELFDSVESLDEVIHQKVRLGIMSALMARPEADFRFLKETLNVILKFEQDVAVVEPQIREILSPPTEK